MLDLNYKQERKDKTKSRMSVRLNQSEFRLKNLESPGTYEQSGVYKSDSNSDVQSYMLSDEVSEEKKDPDPINKLRKLPTYIKNSRRKGKILQFSELFPMEGEDHSEGSMIEREDDESQESDSSSSSAHSYFRDMKILPPMIYVSWLDNDEDAAQKRQHSS